MGSMAHDAPELTGSDSVERTLRGHFTTRPEPPAPQLLCPQCHLPLVYRQTIYTLQPDERTDYFECRTCGPFRFDHDRRVIRPAGRP